MTANLIKDIIDGERMVINLNGTLDDALGQLHINVGVIHDRISHQRVDHTLQIAHATISSLSDILDHIYRYLQTIALALGVQDIHAQLHVGLLELGYQSAGKTGEQAVLHTSQIHWRTVAGQNNLLADTEQVIEDMEESIECFWRIHPLLNIIDNEHVDTLIEVDKIVRGILTYRIGELYLEQTGTDIQHALVRIKLAALQSDGIDQVGFTTTRWTIDKEGIEGGFTWMLGDRETNGARQLVRVTLDIVVKTLLGVELRVELLMAGGIKHIGRLVKMLASRNSLQAGTFALDIGCYIATLTASSLYLYYSVIEFYIGTKHSL